MENTKKQPQTQKLELAKPIKLKVFVVDDDEYFNNIIRSYIRKIGDELNLEIETFSFLNGSDCMKKITLNPDFVILDFYLDENNDITLTGYDVLEKIKKHNADIKVVIISQMHEWENFEEEFRQFGASGFLKKDDELYNNLKKLIENNQTRMT